MKKILLVILVLGVILGGATYWFFDNLDNFIKDYMVEYGSKMTKTDFEISSVKTDLKKGEILINRLGIENPKGFSDAEAFEVDKITVIVKKESWNQDVIEIPLVLINNPEIVYEYNGKKTNFNVLKDNIQSYQSSDSNPSRDKKISKETENIGKHDSKTFFIKELRIVNLEVKARVSSVKRDFLNKKIPLIVIKNIGSESKGASPEIILEKIILNVDDDLEDIFDFTTLKTDIKKNINRLLDKLSGEKKDNSGKEKIDHQKVINNLKDLF
ncbi:MAG: hypothetical protein HOF25_02785 [Nitrosomonadales bacterium]|jgi:hypothetical protein|nr:hypothetical protein [Nitrosomonadales bacterium]MBT5572837.1 hypothetical protein [Nitrosomonadales bacterium]MBT6251287.1 hypothetical protein [Nitrosomonadales bacterium]